MQNARITITKSTVEQLEELLHKASNVGDLRTVTRVKAVLAFYDGHDRATIASILKVSEESIRLWLNAFMLKGVEGLRSKKSPGRPPKLTKSQKQELDDLITKGPIECGYLGACWRTPMIQDLIHEKFQVFYSVHYISQLLKNMGFSYQKAKFESDHKDPEKRKEWLEKTWPSLLKLAKEKNALILFGDEASFPQWGTLTYTWAKRGQQPTVKTSGIRKGYKVFGLIDYFSGKFFFKGQQERLTSATYTQFLQEVLDQTDKYVILVQDGARYHTSKAMNAFFVENKDRLHVEQLPTYSPDYNPIEKLWKKVKQDGTHLHYFPTFEDLVDKVNEVLPTFQNAPEEVLSLFVFYDLLENQEAS